MAKIFHEFGFKIRGCIDKQERIFASVTRNGNILINRNNTLKDTPARRLSKARGKFLGAFMRYYKPVTKVGFPKTDPTAENVVSAIDKDVPVACYRRKDPFLFVNATSDLETELMKNLCHSLLYLLKVIHERLLVLSSSIFFLFLPSFLSFPSSVGA